MPEKNILIVEDERIIAEVISQTIKKMGYGVAGIESVGRKAVETALKKKPDLILMDIELNGEIDGIEAMNMINERINVPVIYITAYMSNSRKKRANLTKTCKYLLKPFENEELKECIKNIFKNCGTYCE